MIYFIISFIILCVSIILFYKTNQIKLQKKLQQQNYQKQLENQIHLLENNRNNLINSQISKKGQLHKDYIQYEKSLNLQKKELLNNLLKWKTEQEQEIQKHLNNQQNNINYKIQQAKKESSKEIENIHSDLQKIRDSAQEEKEQIQSDLDNLKASLNAGVQARLREQEKKEKINFYKLTIKGADSEDVQKLQNLKSSFHKPVVLSKLIWTQYFQKQMTELCDRVLGKKTICGIYKITNLLTEQCYIGQSVDIAKRWKEHCKCGLGIDASSTNKLYQAMQQDKVWNFTFELLEECSKELLNEKESMWINMYQSNKYGYNGNRGNLTK